jgi:hypothetical protein
MSKTLPRYPVYLPSKGRFLPERALTVRTLNRDGVPFRVVVEPKEAEDYARLVGDERVLVLPKDDNGSSTPARNFIMEHSIAEGHERHWCLDDNMNEFRRRVNTDRIPCEAGIALSVCEDFSDRYTNVAISGPSYMSLVFPGVKPPYFLNSHVYSCMLLNNAMPFRWRLPYNEDTDLCLQALASGEWVTILFNAFMVNKIRTMTMKGGNTDDLYAADGRLKMARILERTWPGVVTVSRRYGRPQHVVNWKKFETPLVRRTDIDWDNMPAVDERGMKLTSVREVKSPVLKQYLADGGLPPQTEEA